MHSLEYLLLVLSGRIRRETGNSELACAAVHLASASHEYEPSREPEPLEEMYKDWSRRFDNLLHQ
jgi:hypothetical protein